MNESLLLPSNTFYSIYSDIRVTIFLSFLILCGSAVDIYRFQKIREKKHDAMLKLNSKDIAFRILVFTLVYFLFMALSYYARA